MAVTDSVKMENGRIGKGSLQKNAVIESMKKSTSFVPLLRKWKEFGEKLGLKEHTLLDLERQVNIPTIPLDNVIRELVELWIASKGSDATLDRLCEVLEECALRAIAEELREDFKSKPERECKLQPTDLSGSTKNKLTDTATNDASDATETYENNIDRDQTKDFLITPAKKRLTGRRKRIVAFSSIIMAFYSILMITTLALRGNKASATSQNGDIVTFVPDIKSSNSFATEGLPRTPEDFESTIPTTTYFTTGKSIRRGHERQKVVKVKSSVELDEAMKTFGTTSTSVWIELTLSSLLDWKSGFAIPYADKISGLIIRGPILADLILQIVNQTKYIKLLHIDNSGDEICTVNGGQISLQRSILKTSLNVLGVLILENFGSCVEIYHALASKLEMKNLEGLMIKSGNITPKNVPYIHGLLQMTTNSLTHLSFHKTIFSLDESKPLFDFEWFQLQRLEYLHLDFIPDSNMPNVHFIGPKFCGSVPNLRHLTSDRGIMPWKQVRHILPCQKLRKIKVAVDVPTRRSFFSTIFLKEIPSLTEVKIRLRHEKCNPSTQHGLFLRLEGVDMLPVRIEKLEFLSNCKLKLELSGSQGESSRSTYYFRFNGIYGLKLNTEYYGK